MTIKTVC